MWMSLTNRTKLRVQTLLTFSLMIYARLLSMTLIPLAAVYYLLCVLQLFGVIRFTKADITFPKVLIPFYYFICPTTKKTKK